MRLRRLFVAIVFTVAMVAGGGFAFGVIPGSGDAGTIYACYDVKTGILRVIDYPSVTCPKGWGMTSWNQKGFVSLNDMVGMACDADGRAGVVSVRWAEVEETLTEFVSQLVCTVDAPTVVSVASSTPDGAYRAGDLISVTVTFSEAVTVTGTPTLALDSGGTASYDSGSGTSDLMFMYAVGSTDGSSDLDYADDHALSLAGGTIRDGGGDNAILRLPDPGTSGSLGSSNDIVVDTTAPTVATVTSNTANGTYGTGASIDVRVTFSEPVTVNDVPTIALNAGASAGAAYVSGSGGSTLVFTYTVTTGDAAADLDYASTSALVGTIVDVAGNNAGLTLPTVGSAQSLGGSKNIVVDAVPPGVVSVTSTAANTAYRAGQTIPITVNFSKAVAVTGSPTLELNSGGTATYTSGSGGTTLTFNYVVATGHNSADLNYTSTTALSLDGGTIRAVVSGDNAILTLPPTSGGSSLGGAKSIVIDTTAPTVVSVSSLVADGNYVTGNVIGIRVTFSEPVTVASPFGPPTLALNSGGTAVYASGSGSTVLIFNYTVQAGHTTTDLNYTSTSALTVPAIGPPPIVDVATNAAVRTLPALDSPSSLGGSKDISINVV